MSILFSNSISSFVFFRHACYPIQVLKKSEPDEVHKFLCICFGSFQINLLVTVYHPARIDHGTDLADQNPDQNPSKCFVHVFNQHL